MPPVRSERNRLWSAIVPPSLPRSVASSQPPSLAPSDRHSTSLRLLFQDTERLLQDFSKKHENLLAGTANALKGMANLDEALAATRAETVAEIKNLANAQHLALRDQLSDMGSVITSLSDGCGKMKGRLDRMDQSVGMQIKNAIEILHKRLDGMEEKHIILLDAVNDVQRQVSSKIIPTLSNLESLPEELHTSVAAVNKSSQARSHALLERLDDITGILKSLAARPAPAQVSDQPCSSLFVHTQTHARTPVSTTDRTSFNQDLRSSISSPPMFSSPSHTPYTSPAPPSSRDTPRLNNLRKNLASLNLGAPDNASTSSIRREAPSLAPRPEDRFSDNAFLRVLSQLGTPVTPRRALQSPSSQSQSALDLSQKSLWSASSLNSSLSLPFSTPSLGNSLSSSYSGEDEEMPNANDQTSTRLVVPTDSRKKNRSTPKAQYAGPFPRRIKFIKDTQVSRSPSRAPSSQNPVLLSDDNDDISMAFGF